MGVLIEKTSVFSSLATSGEVEGTSARTRQVRPDGLNSSDTSLPSLRAIRQAAPEKIASLTEQTLKTADPLELMRLLSECLVNMTGDNWLDILSSFEKVATDTGRNRSDELKLARFRAGQVAGESAMDLYTSEGYESAEDARWEILRGWATMDPEAVVAWIKKAEARGIKISPSCYSAVIAGAALVQPGNAIELLAQMPPESRKNAGGQLTWCTVQNGGTDMLYQLLDFSASLDLSDPNNAKLSKDIVDQVSEKLLWRADQARDVAQACDVVEKLVQHGQDPTFSTNKALRKYRYYPMADKLDIIEQINSKRPESSLDLPLLTTTVVGTMNGQKDVVAVREWIDKNPVSPVVPLLLQKVPGAN